MKNIKYLTFGIFFIFLLFITSCGNDNNNISSSKAKKSSIILDTREITIHNNASSKNTDEEINALHVYVNEGMKDDLLTGSDVEVGKEIIIFVYNYASNVKLTITHGDDIIEKTYNVIVPFDDDNKIEKISIILEYDLIVETEAIE